MATASSVQREPSMEEILASIRRIIEDSDTGRKQPDEGDDLRQDLQPASADAFRAEPRIGSEARKPPALAEVQAAPPAAAPVIAGMETPVRPNPAPAKAPVTLTELSARVPAEPREKPPAPAGVAETTRIAETTDAIVANWRREIAAVGETMPKPERAEARRTPEAEPKAEVLDEVTVEPAPEWAPSRSELARPATSEMPPPRPAILSEHTGRQVSAAFGELSDAFASRSKKTFDEMAEEMLRPMLQDWLDNNLPTLVERLVREEIERVARGAQ